MKYPGKKKSARTGIRVTVPLFMLVLVIVASVLIIYSTPVLTIEKRTSGNLTFTDGGGNQISGTIEISMIGAPPGRKDNVNSITWRNAPNAWIYFDAHDTRSVSMNLRISDDSPSGVVSLEDHGAALPGSVERPAPGTPVKYVELISSGVTFIDADISIYYTDAELGGLDEKSLVIYSYDGGVWNELPAKVDALENAVTATVDSLSIFAISTQATDEINEIVVRDTRNKPVVSQIKTYDNARSLKKEARSSTLAIADVTENGELEVDALESKSVAVRLKLKRVNRGEVVLDDFGKNNPESVPLPGRVVKFVEIGASGISFSSASITIRYSDEELNGGTEHDLTIYHWNGASWEAMPTIIDFVNKTLSATTTSFSSFGAATTVTYRYLPSTGATVATGVTTNFDCPTSYPTVYSKALLTTSSSGGCGATRQYGNNLDPALDTFYNTAYTDNTNVTGKWIYGRMRDGSSGGGTFTFRLIYIYANGTIVTLPGTPATQTIASSSSADYNVSLSGMSGVVPAGAKLGLRVSLTGASTQLRWYVGDTANTAGTGPSGHFSVTETPVYYNISGYVKSTSGSQLNGATVQTNTSLNTTTNATGFYNFGGLSDGGYTVNASLTGYVTNSTNVTISSADVANANITLSSTGGALPNLTSWGNNKTNNQASSITLNTSEGVRFNATANQSITTWNWYVNDNNQNNNQSTFNISWGTTGSYNVDVNATNSNGTSNTINWAVRVITNVTVQGEITDHDLNPLVAYHETEDDDEEHIESGSGSTYNYIVPIGGQILFNASTTKNVSADFTIQGASTNSKVILDDYHASNPVSSVLPGTAVKYVNISASNMNYSEVEVKIYYTNAEISGMDENALVIYHWNGAAWDELPTTVDAANNVLTATTTSLSPFGVATRFIYYLENNATIQSVGFDGNTEYSTSGTIVSLALRPYVNLLKNGTMGASNNIGFTTTSTTTEYWLFSFYLPFNYSVNTRIAANTTFNLSWDATNANNRVNVSLIDYNPVTGADIVIGNRSFTATGGTTLTTYSYQINHSTYTVPEDHRLLFRINTTTPTIGTVYLYFNNYVSNITVVETALGYNLSGRVTDKYSGSALSGATVMTNTSLSTTTNSTGYYNFTGLSNDTYLLNASFTGYVTNSTIATINGANVMNANITLSLAYLLSGYVTNASTGTAISGATVTTNTSETTTTNATGYYNFTLSNGTYLITASKSGYSDNSTTKTVNGAVVNNVNITLTATQTVTGQILVATNRYVILDDPIATGKSAQSDENFSVPPTGWTSNYWNGFRTQIMGYALLLDENGKPINNTNVTFSLRNWDNSDTETSTNITTDLYGLANYTFDMNARNYYGRWNITATAIGKSNTYGFIYNWFGCQVSGCESHGSRTPSSYETPADINSPYTKGAESITNFADHSSVRSDANCVGCHRSYSGKGGSNTFTGQATKTSDVHVTNTCATCHGSGTTHQTDQPIKSCDDCHNRTDISMKSTKNGIVSNYSNSTSSTYNKYHTPNSTVPCIICHGPMHNISKPDITQNFTRNNDTESTHCTTCHSSYNKHNNSVNCTLCHSDDAHAIKVFAQNATYITLNKDNPNSARGNCTNCHQNSTFYGILKAQPNATNQTGRNASQVAAPVRHSNNNSAGAKWKQTYWTNSQQLTWCIYCHSNTTHSTVALGRPASWDGNNIVNSSLTPGNTTWCAGCHWQGYANGSSTYNDMVNTFTGAGLLVPPEISGNTTNGANTSIYEYTNHSLYTSYSAILNDSACNRCHGYQYSFTKITQLMHNQSSVGGPDCVSCHDTGGIVLLSKINVTATNNTNAIHRNLNSGASATNSSAYYSNNKRCWACHGNGSEPSPYAHPSRYKTPYNCTDCHVQSATQNFNYTNTSRLLNVTEHYWNGTDIKTPNASVCYICHNVSEMMISANDPDAGSGAVYGGANGGNGSPSHYGIKRADIRTGTSANCSYCHQNASTAFATAMIDPSYNRSISNHSLIYNSSNPTCTSSLCHNTGWIHNATLKKPVVNTTLCLSCHGSNGTGGTNYSGAVTGIKEKHNNSVNCTECHIDTSKDIHPVKYLRSDSTFSSSNSSAATCVTCHQTTDVDSKLTQTPPKITSHLYHSDNTSNGTIWNSTAYWTPTSPVTACIYCHNNTKHNATALGRPVDWKGNNMINSSIASGTWCASCHYQSYSSGSKNYTNMTRSFANANLSVPPEITNGTYARNIYNRSGYYNHSLRNYSDEICRQCHGIDISSSTTITAFMHNITGASCTECHYSFGAMNNTTRPDRYVDQGMYNTSLHRSLSCSNCHTQGHRNIGARKACEDCHAVQANPITDKDRHNITSTPSTYFYNSVNVVNITNCTTCHDSALYNRSISTYGYWKQKDCDYCHTYPDKYYE